MIQIPMERKALIKILEALSYDLRMDVMNILLKAGPDGMPAGEIAMAVDSTPSKLTFHLNILENAGLVSSARQSRHKIYKAEIAQHLSYMAALRGAYFRAHEDFRKAFRESL